MQSNSAEVMQQPARFLGAIPKALTDEWNLKPFSPYG
jgi:hypothetical protein